MSKKYTHEVSFWIQDENEEYPSKHICTIPSVKIPEIGEVFHLDTRMDRDWFAVRKNDFNMSDSFVEGFVGDFRVSHIKRYIKTYDIVGEEKLETRTFVFASQRYVETFEVFVEKLKEI